MEKSWKGHGMSWNLVLKIVWEPCYNAPTPNCHITSSLFAVLELGVRCAAWLSRSNSGLAVSGSELSCQRIGLTCVNLFCLS